MFKRYDRSLTSNLFQHHEFGFRADGDTIEADTKLMDHAFVWCFEQFGLPGKFNDPDARWLSGSHAIFFKSEVDATAFRLRWC